MRKLKLQVQISLDGYIAGTNNEMDWMTMPWSKDIEKYVEELTKPVDTIVLGRKLAEGFIPHWAGVAADPNNLEQQAGKKFTDTPKVVFTKTLEKADWDNTTLAKGDLADEINKIKNEQGNDIMVYGGSDFVSNLIKENLIDEFHLFVNAAAIGEGMPVFRQRTDLKFVRSQAFDCGIVVLVYKN